MFIKMCVLGRRYFYDSWNTFDCLVTICSLVDIVLDWYGKDADLLRALRVARIMRLLRINKNMARFSRTASAVLPDVLAMSGVLGLILFVFALLGMELFGGQLGSPPPRVNFDFFSNSFLSSFIICSGEDWPDAFANSLVADNWMISVFYFCALFIIGNFVLVNLFVAIICFGWDSAADSQLEMSQEDREAMERVKLQLSKNLTMLRQRHAALMLVLQSVVQGKAYGFTPMYGSQVCATVIRRV